MQPLDFSRFLQDYVIIQDLILGANVSLLSSSLQPSYSLTSLKDITYVPASSIKICFEMPCQVGQPEKEGIETHTFVCLEDNSPRIYLLLRSQVQKSYHEILSGIQVLAVDNLVY